MYPAHEFNERSTVNIQPSVECCSSNIHKYIEAKYRECYEADILCSYSHLLAVTDFEGSIKAAVGYRTPDEAFFLEQYLDSSADDVLSEHYGEKIGRNQIVEIGNLVGDNSHAVFFLMQELWGHLYQRHYEHVMLTCTRKLRRRFRNLPLFLLSEALRESVDSPKSWGSYYDQKPCVMTGKLCLYDQRFKHNKRNMGFHLQFSTSARRS